MEDGGMIVPDRGRKMNAAAPVEAGEETLVGRFREDLPLGVIPPSHTK